MTFFFIQKGMKKGRKSLQVLEKVSRKEGRKADTRGQCCSRVGEERTSVTLAGWREVGKEK